MKKLKVIIIAAIVAMPLFYAASCSGKRDEGRYTVQSIYRGDTFYLMNRKPLTLAEAEEMCRKEKPNVVSKPYPWDSAWRK